MANNNCGKSFADSLLSQGDGRINSENFAPRAVTTGGATLFAPSPTNNGGARGIDSTSTTGALVPFGYGNGTWVGDFTSLGKDFNISPPAGGGARNDGWKVGDEFRLSDFPANIYIDFKVLSIAPDGISTDPNEGAADKLLITGATGWLTTTGPDAVDLCCDTPSALSNGRFRKIAGGAADTLTISVSAWEKVRIFEANPVYGGV